MDNRAGTCMDKIVQSSCRLEKHDELCGLIFFGVKSRMLKFLCSLCAKTYDNIIIFSKHCEQHMQEGNTKQNDDVENISLFEQSTGPEKSEVEQRFQPSDEVEGNANYYTEWSIEKLVEAAEIEAEVEEEIWLTNEDYRKEDLSVSYGDYLDHTEKESINPVAGAVGHKSYAQESLAPLAPIVEETLQDMEHMGTEDFEKIFDADENEIFTIPQNTLSRTKNITRIKVIPSKNHIQELYEKIKLEVQRLSEVTELSKEVDGALNEKNQSANTFANNEYIQEYGNQEQTCKVIGETVITSLSYNSQLPTTKPSSENVTDVRNTSYYSNQKPSKCIACDKVFRSPFSLTIHKRIHYLESRNSIKLAHKCSHCDLLFNRMVQLKDHIQKVHYAEGFICKICNKKLSSLTLLETHMRKVHLNRPFNCNVCKKTFDDNDTLRLHCDTHILHIAGQSYKCHMCGRKFSTEELLKQHVQRHKERVPQCCVVCGKMTLRITQHMKMHAPRPKRIIQCKICDKVFNFSSGLSHHFRVMHRHPRSPPKPTKKDDTSKNTKRNTTTLEQHQKQYQKCNSYYDCVEDTNQKEKEATRVIVELIQNANYTSFLNDHFETAPPIAREETITSVTNIVAGTETNVFDKF